MLYPMALLLSRGFNWQPKRHPVSSLFRPAIIAEDILHADFVDFLALKVSLAWCKRLWQAQVEAGWRLERATIASSFLAEVLKS